MASSSSTRLGSFFSFSKNPIKTQQKCLQNVFLSIGKPSFSLSISTLKSYNATTTSKRFNPISCKSISTEFTNINYDFSDGPTEVELKLPLGSHEYQSSKDIFVDADGTSLIVRLQTSGSSTTLIETNHLFDKIKPAETIWYIDEDQLVLNLKKQDPDLKWPDIIETWESLTAGAIQLLKGTSIYIVGDSTEINQIVARELAVGLGYTPLHTQELLETFARQTVDSWAVAEGYDSVATGESVILESLSSNVRTVVSTLGGLQGAARKADKWQHLYAGFTVWLSQTTATAEDLAKEEARRHIEDGKLAYSNADVVVKVQGWDADYAKNVAQASLSALKQLVMSDKKLPNKKSLYIRLGCRGDWPNIKPTGWDPSAQVEDETS
ncbi:probable inactive shikimate kinase like 2, chloroplastic [Euphorbia lathyris]|uniref:probable inactive shikimate kinase like 2, chloroplastic n=1 Tax=Euphorbia lathyris TaxID=212925 RepID=UPI0033140E1B